ncbi:MAG: hypothetical protein COA58_09555 [Bacteroidetes bacterium]|nr:MAG: hypothetical protein COA58_09555 [Bacteroidota bacterium]
MTSHLPYHFGIYLVLLVVGFILQFTLSSRDHTLRGHGDWKKFIFFNLIILTILLLFYFAPTSPFWIHGTIALFGFFELISSKTKPLYLILFLPLIVSFAFGYWVIDSNLLATTLLLTAVFDGYSQLTGKLFGRHKLTPSISPNKTIEGFIGGTFVVYLTAFALHSVGYKIVPIFILFLPAFALLGDLGASFIKRKSNIKDFGRLLPGQGGILDRFDSYIATTNWILLFYILTALHHVYIT